MAWELDGQTTAVEQALAGGAPQSVGWFRFSFTEVSWEWSEQVQRMHGYEPGTLAKPTLEQVLSHKHPDDRERVAAGIDEMINTRQGFSTRHRIIDTHGAVHQVLVAGDSFRDKDGEVVGIYGFYIDITAEFEDEHEDVITAKVTEIAERRAAIEQAKGMLMLVYRIDDAAAFDLLKWLSQENNVKLQLLARQIAKDFTAVDENTLTSRTTFDQLLLTAHLRANGVARSDGSAVSH